MLGRRTALNGGNATFFLLGCIATLSFLSLERFLSETYFSNRYHQSNTTKKVAIVFGDSITQHGFNPQNEG